MAVDAAWDAWRNRALDALQVAVCVIGGAMFLPAFLSDAALLPIWRLPTLAIYLLLVLTSISRRGFRARSWSLVVLAYLATTVMLINRGLVGYGRVGLAIYPCWITLLMGSRAGWGAAALSLGIYGAVAVWSIVGIPPEWGVGIDPPATPMIWLVQAMGLAMAVVPSVVLLSRFQEHHMRLLREEQQASRQLKQEVIRRTAAYASLEREHAERTRLEEEMTHLSEEERRRLGREVHDGLCQQLTAALLRCTALQERLHREQAAEGAAQAARLRLLIQEMLDVAYVISKGIWPVGPEPDGLVPALQAMARRTAEEFGLTCEFGHDGNAAVPDSETAMHLYRIAQEAVSNSFKHAGASRISIRLLRDRDAVVLTVTDDGCGPPDVARAGRGMGLSIMAHRARSIGGMLAITGAEGGGTVVNCRVPCAGPASSQGGRNGN